MAQRFEDARSPILLADVVSHDDGYKIIRGKIARTGVQTYLGREFGGDAALNGFGDNDKVIVYRSPKEVFSDKAINGWKGVPVTLDHPPELVNSENVSKYSVGDVRDMAHVDRESGWFGLEWMIRDKDAVTAFDSGGYLEVSGGYTAIIDWTGGVTPEGIRYDAEQVDITPNHLALTPNGRAFGDTANDGSNKWGAAPQPIKDKEPGMDFVKIMVGDKAVQVAVADADVVTKLVADHSVAIADKDTEIGELKAKLVDANSKVPTDEELTALVDAKVEAQVKRDAVIKHFGDEAVKDASEAEIAGMFKVMDKSTDDAARKALGDRKVVDADPWAAFKKGDK